MVRSHHQLNGHELSKLQKIEKDKEAWRAAKRVAKNRILLRN